MSKVSFISSVVLLMALVGVSFAEHSGDVQGSDTLSGGFWGLNDQLAEEGIEMDLGITSIYQANVKGGLSTNRRRGRYSGSYDLELKADTYKLFGIDGGSLYLHGEGWWPKAGGIDGISVGSAFGVNGDAGARDSFVITEFWWEQAMLDNTLLLRFGKLDLTGGFECSGCPVSFDASSFAHDEACEFINSALVNNPTIPFPDYGLGAALYWNPIEWWYASVGVADAQADARETGLRTTFGGEDYFFYIFETGVTPKLDSVKGPLQGAYRVGVWYDPQPKVNSDGTKNYRDDMGFYTSCDQMVFMENSDPTDSQGLGIFFRYGYAPSRTNDITDFYSFGLEYEGLIEGRDNDALGIGFAHGIFSNSASTTYTSDYENAVELYYNSRITDWLSISPSIQYITNPGGNKAVSDAVVLGLRAQIAF